MGKIRLVSERSPGSRRREIGYRGGRWAQNGSALSSSLAVCSAFSLPISLSQYWASFSGSILVSSDFIRRSVCHKSWACCNRSQRAGPLPANLPMRSAISVVMGWVPARTRWSCCRDTPSRRAASLTDNPRAGSTSSRRISPGWGAFRTGGGTVRQGLQDRPDSFLRFRMKRGKFPSSPAAGSEKQGVSRRAIRWVASFLSLSTIDKFIQKLRILNSSMEVIHLSKVGDIV